MTPQRSFVEPSAARTDHPAQQRRGWSLLRPFNPPIADWRGQRVCVVGASSGIGLATAEALIARGANVQVSARGAAALQRLVEQHTRTGEPPQVQAWPLDVTDATAVAATARAILAQGPLNLVLYCAGHYREMRATHMDLADMQQHLAINYTGALNVLDAVLPALIARSAGHISLISSVAGFRGLPKSLAYGPTKSALTNLAETLYLDLEPPASAWRGARGYGRRSGAQRLQHAAIYPRPGGRGHARWLPAARSTSTTDLRRWMNCA
jgi:NADP-dependent 3-hydroxy acid dehydrogenase YdfG